MSTGWIESIVVAWAVSFVLAYLIGRDVGRRGALYGLLLGPLGLVLVTLLPRRKPTRSRIAGALERIGILSLIGWHASRGWFGGPTEWEQPEGDIYTGD